MHACTRRGISSSHAAALTEEKRHTCGICEPEGDRLVFDVAHVANGHLARVVGKVFGSEVLDLQHLGFTLWHGTQQNTRFSAWERLVNMCGFQCVGRNHSSVCRSFFACENKNHLRQKLLVFVCLFLLASKHVIFFSMSKGLWECYHEEEK